MQGLHIQLGLGRDRHKARMAGRATASAIASGSMLLLLFVFTYCAGISPHFVSLTVPGQENEHPRKPPYQSIRRLRWR